MKKVCIYARVSTQGQDYQRQLSELREYASRMNYEIVREFSEKISGAKSVAERQALTELLDYAAANRIDKVLVYECSRISRRAIDFLQVIEQLTQMKVSVYILQNGLETLMADGSVNPIAQLVLDYIGHLLDHFPGSFGTLMLATKITMVTAHIAYTQTMFRSVTLAQCLLIVKTTTIFFLVLG